MLNPISIGLLSDQRPLQGLYGYASMQRHVLYVRYKDGNSGWTLGPAEVSGGFTHLLILMETEHASFCILYSAWCTTGAEAMAESCSAFNFLPLVYKEKFVPAITDDCWQPNWNSDDYSYTQSSSCLGVSKPFPQPWRLWACSFARPESGQSTHVK